MFTICKRTTNDKSIDRVAEYNFKYMLSTSLAGGWACGWMNIYIIIINILYYHFTLFAISMERFQFNLVDSLLCIVYETN